MCHMQYVVCNMYCIALYFIILYLYCIVLYFIVLYVCMHYLCIIIASGSKGLEWSAAGGIYICQNDPKRKAVRNHFRTLFWNQRRVLFWRVYFAQKSMCSNTWVSWWDFILEPKSWVLQSSQGSILHLEGMHYVYTCMFAINPLADTYVYGHFTFTYGILKMLDIIQLNIQQSKYINK